MREGVKMQVSVHNLKNNLSKYLHRVEEGEVIIVTSHRTPFAKITAITSLHDPKSKLAVTLEGVNWNGKKPKGNDSPPKISGKTAADYILEDRE